MPHEDHHEHEEGHGHALILPGVASVLFFIGLLTEGAVSSGFFLLAFLTVGFEVLKNAAENALHGEWFDETFLMALAAIGAIGIGEYKEAAAVMILYQLGEFLQDKAVDSSRHSIRALMDIRPDTARIVENGSTREIPAGEVAIGAVIEVRAGERIPLDGIVEGGSSTLNTAALTGESLPQEAVIGDEVRSGCINLSGTLHLRVTTPFGEDSASRILALVEHAEESKSEPERFITRFAHIYTPAVIVLAALLAAVPPLLGFGTFSVFLLRALNFLVISCPCALVISIPLTFFSGIGCASHHGILIKGGNYLDTLSRVNVAAFDKTGTLTEGRFAVTDLWSADGISEERLLELAAYGEAQSRHPLAKSILQAYSCEIDASRLSDVQEISGHGVRAVLDGKKLLVGKKVFLSENGIFLPNTEKISETAVFVAYDGQYCGIVLLRDVPKKDAKQAISALHSLGIVKTLMLTGDHTPVAEKIGREVGIDEVKAGLLPEQKLQEIGKLKQKMPQAVLLYTGDGINDTPVLKAADVGIAMGGLGTDAAMEAADVVIMSDEPSRIAEAINIARKTMRIAKENIVFSIAVKVIILLLSGFGLVALWAAVFADVGVCMIAILNSLRAMR